MKKSLIFLASFLFISTSASAEVTDMDHCAISGYYAGSKNSFMSNISTEVLAKKNILNDPACKVEYDFGVTVGKRLLISQSDVFSEPSSLNVALRAYEFEKKVFQQLIEKIGI